MTAQSESTARPAERNTLSSRTFARFLMRWSNVLALLLLLVIATLLSPYFLSTRNILNVLRGASMVGIVSIGMTFVILNRGIDLSVGSILGVSAALVAALAPMGIGVGLLAGLAAGTVLGLINGLLITRLRLQPFIATLAMLIFARGMVYIYSDGSNIVVKDATDSFAFLGSGYIGPVPTPVILAAVVWLACAWILNRTVFGREIYAVGANEEAARLSGIHIGRNRICVYAISGLLAALAGVVMTSRLTVAEPNAGTLFELDAIAATLIGGTTFDGGRGSVHGTVLGVLILSFLSNILNLLNVSPYSQMLLKGVIIVVAVVISEFKKRN